MDDPGGVLVQPGTMAEYQTKLRKILPWAVAVLGVVIAGVAVWILKPTPLPEPRQVIRLKHVLQGSQQFSNLDLPALAVSPNGRQVVYSTTEGLYLRSFERWDAILISGTDENPTTPFFSPNGQWIGYWSQRDNQLKKIDPTEGAPFPLCDVGFIYNAFWYTDNTIIYSEVGKGIMQVSGNGGTPEVFIGGNETFLHPRLLPDGKSVLFALLSDEKFNINVQSLESGERKLLFKGDFAHYVPTGHIAYVVDSNLFAVPFDLDTLKTTGSKALILEGVLQRSGAPQYAISDSGTLVFLPETTTVAASGRTLVWVDREGNEEPLSAPPNAYNQPIISPEGERVALSIDQGGNVDIYIWDSVREDLTRLTTAELADIDPLWTPDGQRILFSSTRDGRYDIFWRAADGTGEDEVVYSAINQWIFPISWADNGTTLICVLGNTSNYDITALSFDGDHEMKRLLDSKYMERFPAISPDGRWMAYVSDEEGQSEVYMRPYPELNKRFNISTNGGREPLWSPDSRELFYRNGDLVTVVSVGTELTFKPGKPKVLFPDTYLSLSDYITWNIHSDGKRFMMIKEAKGDGTSEATSRPKINIVLN